MKTTIAKAASFENYYQHLGNKEDKLFETMKDVMLFCALLAINKERKREPLLKKGGDSIKFDYFTSNDRTLIDMIALYSTEDISILTNEKHDLKLELFEEYANAGMAYIVNRFNHIPNELEVRTVIYELRPEVTYTEKIDLAELVMESI